MTDEAKSRGPKYEFYDLWTKT